MLDLRKLKFKQKMFKCDGCGFKSFKNYRECPICGLEKQDSKEKESKFKISFEKILKNAYYLSSLIVLTLTAIAMASMPSDVTIEVPAKVIVGILVFMFLVYVGKGVEGS